MPAAAIRRFQDPLGELMMENPERGLSRPLLDDPIVFLYYPESPQ
jgi:hypothetical protein